MRTVETPSSAARSCCYPVNAQRCWAISSSCLYFITCQ